MDRVDELAKILWDYHHVHHTLTRADYILALGSNDTRVAEYAATLYKEGWAPRIIFSGDTGRLTEHWDRPEADIFAEIAVQHGVLKEHILIENTSLNTGENIRHTKALLDRMGLSPSKIMLVQKPYMERRAYATAKKLWPEIEWIVTSPPLSYEHYFTKDIPKEMVINAIVGDLERIKLYPEKGFQIPQEIPVPVWHAYEELVRLGYTKDIVSPFH